MLVVCPTPIRKQWSLELEEKFNLPTIILDASTYRTAQKSGVSALFVAAGVVQTLRNDVTEYLRYNARRAVNSHSVPPTTSPFATPMQPS